LEELENGGCFGKVEVVKDFSEGIDDEDGR
jgi:hypothetical protein